jgi:hypothetical protein
MWRFAFREHFIDALALFELYALSAGRHVDTFREWQQVAHRVRREESEQSAAGAPRRRRRRRTRS